MTALPFHEAREKWSMAYLTDQLFNNLVSFDKYREQARALFHRIPVKRQHAPFVIQLLDLSERVQAELQACKKSARVDVLREAVARIFEGIDYYYTQLSIMPFLVVRLEK